MVGFRLVAHNDLAKSYQSGWNGTCDIVVTEQTVLGRRVRHNPPTNYQYPATWDQLSGVHCTLAVRDGSLAVNDQSTNGTYVNDERAAKGELQAVKKGDRLSLSTGVKAVEYIVDVVDDATDQPASNQQAARTAPVSTAGAMPPSKRQRTDTDSVSNGTAWQTLAQKCRSRNEVLQKKLQEKNVQCEGLLKALHDKESMLSEKEVQFEQQLQRMEKQVHEGGMVAVQQLQQQLHKEKDLTEKLQHQLQSEQLRAERLQRALSTAQGEVEEAKAKVAKLEASAEEQAALTSSLHKAEMHALTAQHERQLAQSQQREADLAQQLQRQTAEQQLQLQKVEHELQEHKERLRQVKAQEDGLSHEIFRLRQSLEHERMQAESWQERCNIQQAFMQTCMNTLSDLARCEDAVQHAQRAMQQKQHELREHMQHALSCCHTAESTRSGPTDVWDPQCTPLAGGGRMHNQQDGGNAPGSPTQLFSPNAAATSMHTSRPQPSPLKSTSSVPHAHRAIAATSHHTHPVSPTASGSNHHERAGSVEDVEDDVDDDGGDVNDNDDDVTDNGTRDDEGHGDEQGDDEGSMSVEHTAAEAQQQHDDAAEINAAHHKPPPHPASMVPPTLVHATLPILENQRGDDDGAADDAATMQSSGDEGQAGEAQRPSIGLYDALWTNSRRSVEVAAVDANDVTLPNNETPKAMVPTMLADDVMHDTRVDADDA